MRYEIVLTVKFEKLSSETLVTINKITWYHNWEDECILRRGEKNNSAASNILIYFSERPCGHVNLNKFYVALIFEMTSFFQMLNRVLVNISH